MMGRKGKIGESVFHKDDKNKQAVNNIMVTKSEIFRKQ